MNPMIPTFQKERDAIKTPGTLDQALDSKINPIIDLINSHNEKVYKDFNSALMKQIEETAKVEKDISHMVQVLWGIQNKANARAAALESVLLKNGMDETELATEIASVEALMEEQQQMQKVDLNKVAEKTGLVGI